MKYKLILAGLFGMIMGNSAIADEIGGSPVYDSKKAELRIPCVLVENLDPGLDGSYFDVILKQRGSSMNFELSFAALEDGVVCEAAAAAADVLDDDLVPEESDSPL